MLSKINFVVNETKLKQMAYGDSIYAWLLLHSHYDETEDHNYIYAKDFTFVEISSDIHKSRQVVSKRFKALLDSNNEEKGKDLIIYDDNNKCYYLPCFREFEKLDSQTVLNLFWLCGQGNIRRKEELIKLYAWLKKKKRNSQKEISFEDILFAFGHAKGNTETYDRYKDLLTTLQGAGLIKFRTGQNIGRVKDGKFGKTFYIYQVNDKASQEWLDWKKEKEKK